MACAGDCDDTTAAIGPAATEVCDGLDDDCDSVLPADEVDGDGDGWLPCEGFVDLGGPASGGGDCDEAEPTVHPGADEGCDGIDTDCNGPLGDDELDLDGDGETACDGDCAPNDATVNTSATETCDGVDENCDGVIDEGFDVDADGETSCGGDCDDADPAIHTGAAEQCNGIDDDCDGLLDDTSGCPCGVEQYDGHAYLFCETALDWGDARDACLQQTSFDLVTIDDGVEQAWIWSQVLVYSGSDWWWIGYTDSDARWWEEPDDEWDWVDGSSSTYTNWANNQPDNWGNEDCAHMYGDSGLWNDLDCGATSWSNTWFTYYVCESSN